MKKERPNQVVREAEHVVRRFYLRMCAQKAAGELAGTRGLAQTPLFPGTGKVHLVAYDGEPLGYVRCEGVGWGTGWWAAVPMGCDRPRGHYHSAAQAAAVLARLKRLGPTEESNVRNDPL